ncbi:hypothetical protein ACU4GI_47090 (plasmid) [Cupriavidus basilensis]
MMTTAIAAECAATHQQIFRLEAFASGRYDVYSAINGLRAGSLVGGMGNGARSTAARRWDILGLGTMPQWH